MKKILILLMVLLLLQMSWHLSAFAEDTTNAWGNYAHETEIKSEEAVELHIGLTFETAANNPLLEQAFLLKYPNGKIVYHLYTLDQLNAYLMGNGSELDMLLVSDSTRQTLVNHRVLQNLYETGLLSQWPDSWIDLRQQLETEDGQLYGFPRSVEVGYFSWYDDLGAQVGMEKPDALWTWDDFTRMATDVNYDVDGNGTQDFCLLSGMYFDTGMTGFHSAPLEVYTYQRVLQGGSFSSQEFSRLLEQFIEVYQSQALIPDDIALFQERRAQLIMSITESGSGLWTPDGYSYLNYPTLYPDTPAYLGRSYVFALLNNAPHPELALEFLHTSLELCERRIYDDITTYMNQSFPDTQITCWDSTTSVGFMPNEKGELIRVCQPGDSTLQTTTDFTNVLSPQNFTDYNFMRSHFLPITGQWYSVSSVLYEMLPQYFNGSITLAQITTAMDQRIRMMQNE